MFRSLRKKNYRKVFKEKEQPIDNAVNSETLRAHLALLAKFKALEQADERIDMRYLLRAQERYLLWLNLLSSQNFDIRTEPVPPIGKQRILNETFL